MELCFLILFLLTLFFYTIPTLIFLIFSSLVYSIVRYLSSESEKAHSIAMEEAERASQLRAQEREVLKREKRIRAIKEIH